MSFRIPYALLTETHKTQIVRDLRIQEKTDNQYWRKDNRYSKVKTKEIIFYSVDPLTNDILLPMYYASRLFNTPLINKRKVFHKVPPFQLNVPLFDYQNEVVDISIKNFMQRGSTFLNVFCSFGKTVVAAYFSAMFSQKYGLVTLVVYTLKVVETSWVGTFKNRTNAKIYIVGETPGPPDDDVQVFLCMDTRLPDLDPTIRMRIGHFVIDEADCFCTLGRIKCFFSIEPLFTTALTATYERLDGFHIILDCVVGPDRITRISKKPFFVFQRPTIFEANPKVGPRGIVFDDLVAQFDSIPERNSMIIEMILHNLSEKILVLTKHVEHAENLHKWLTYYLQPYGKTVSLLAKNMRKYDDASVIIATISKAGRGFDEKEACHDWKGERINMLILASSTRQIEQIAGRVFRSEIPIIIDFVDNHKNTQSHWITRKKWYESRNGIIYSTIEHFMWSNIKEPIVSHYFNSLKNGGAGPPPPQLKNDIPDELSKSHAHKTALMLAQMKGYK
jgi:hypothetical protein